MVDLAPPLKAVLGIRLSIENGYSVSQSIKLYSEAHQEDLFAKELGFWLYAQSAGRNYSHKIFDTFYRKRLLEILNSGLKGEPVLKALTFLEEDLVFISQEFLEQHIQKLPLMALLPLMLFQFPSYFLLLIGPLLLNLLSTLQN